MPVVAEGVRLYQQAACNHWESAAPLGEAALSPPQKPKGLHLIPLKPDGQLKAHRVLRLVAWQRCLSHPGF